MTRSLKVPEPDWPLPLGFENASPKAIAIYKHWLKDEDKYLSEYRSGFLSLTSWSDDPKQFEHPTYMHEEDENLMVGLEADSSWLFKIINLGIKVNLNAAHAIRRQREEYRKNPTKGLKEEFARAANMGLEGVIKKKK